MRARAILRSLVSMEDLEGILSLHFLLPEPSKPDSVPPGRHYFEDKNSFVNHLN